MDTLAKKLDAKFREWQPDTAQKVRQMITEIIELADQDSLDIPRFRTVEQEVLNLPDELDAAYKLMSEDKEREAEALEWAEALVGEADK